MLYLPCVGQLPAVVVVLIQVLKYGEKNNPFGVSSGNSSTDVQNFSTSLPPWHSMYFVQSVAWGNLMKSFSFAQLVAKTKQNFKLQYRLFSNGYTNRNTTYNALDKLCISCKLSIMVFALSTCAPRLILLKFSLRFMHGWFTAASILMPYIAISFVNSQSLAKFHAS